MGLQPASGHGKNSQEPRTERSGIPRANCFKERFHGLLSALMLK